jgi:hypothetical protein
MKVLEHGAVQSGSGAGDRAVASFPSLAALPDGSVLATYSIGSGKDTADVGLELRRSTDGGRTWSSPWSPFASTVGGVAGSFKAGHVTPLSDGRLIIAALWVDREAHPGAPLFNPVTEGCLPMSILLAESRDRGTSWSPWRVVPMPPDVGPPSLTNPILRLPSGRLALSIETNKPYLDGGPWRQRVVYLWSADDGRTWSDPETVCEDPTGRTFNWDQRTALAPDGRLVSFSWSYDRVACRYLEIRRRISADEGRTWSAPEDVGFADQPSHPAILPDGRVVLAWVDRWQSASIRARLAVAIDAPFEDETEVILHEARPSEEIAGTGDLLVEMNDWSYGLPFAVGLPDSRALVVWYGPTGASGGEGAGTGIRWARLDPD